MQRFRELTNGKERQRKITIFSIFIDNVRLGFFYQTHGELSVVVVVVDIPRQVIRTFIYIGWAWVARWITTAGPTDVATALKSGLIYYYVLLLLFGYLYLYNIMPREIPRSRRYVTVQLPRDRDLIFRIGHILGRALLATSNIIYYLNSFTAPRKISLVYHIVSPRI